jgi:general stress protein YciG
MAENMQEQENRGNLKGNQRGRSNRGFASMDPDQQREIASKGGQAAHRQGVAHEWTSEEARAAGRKGGQASRGGGRARNAGDNSDNSGQLNETNPIPEPE